MLTAVEDFVAAAGRNCGSSSCRRSSASASCGTSRAVLRDALARILDPWDRNPILERLEANRVHQLARRTRPSPSCGPSESASRASRPCCGGCWSSSAFAVAERLSLLRIRAGVATAQSVISKDEVRRVLEP